MAERNVRITERQKQVLKSVIGFINLNGYPPTTREICVMLDLPTIQTNAAVCHLRALERKGYLSFDGCGRGIEIHKDENDDRARTRVVKVRTRNKKTDCEIKIE